VRWTLRESVRFLKGRSTLGALESVLKVAEQAASGTVRNRHLCALVTLDVRNAFNSDPWHLVDAALRARNVTTYLIKILRSYMQDRSLIIGGGTQNVRSRKVTCGVPQGSVLGPALWNIYYDDLLRINLPSGTTLIGFADDVALTAVAHTTPLLEDLVNNVLARVNLWMEEHQLSLAPKSPRLYC